MGVKNPAQSPLPNKAATVNEQDKAIIKEFKEAMAKGDERAALRAEAKYRRIDVKPEKNIYDYGPNDPDPTIDYYFEPLNPEQQAKFDKEDRREHGLTKKKSQNIQASLPQGANQTRSSSSPKPPQPTTHPSSPTHSPPSAKTPTIRSP